MRIIIYSKKWRLWENNTYEIAGATSTYKCWDPVAAFVEGVASNDVGRLFYLPKCFIGDWPLPEALYYSFSQVGTHGSGAL